MQIRTIGIASALFLLGIPAHPNAEAQNAEKIFTTVRQLHASKPFKRDRIESIIGRKFSDIVAGEMKTERDEKSPIDSASAYFSQNGKIDAIDLLISKSHRITPADVLKSFGKKKTFDWHPKFHTFDNRTPFTYNYSANRHQAYSFEFENGHTAILRRIGFF